MKRILPRLLAGALFVGAVAGVACNDDGTVNTGEARNQAQNAATDVRQEAREAWATLRTDGERLIDQIQTRNDPQAKQQLLDSCRDTLEELRQSDVTNADRVNQLCDRIRDADPNVRNTWDEIRREIDELNNRYRS